MELFRILSTESPRFKVDYRINIKKADGREYDCQESWGFYHCIDDCESCAHNQHLCDVEFRRDDLLIEDGDIMMDGTVTFEVRIRLHPDDYCHVDRPVAAVSDNMMELYLKENEEDVAFKVKGQIIKTHSIILRAQAKELAELRETYDVTNPMPVEDVDPAVFQLMLDTLYGKQIDSTKWREQSKAILKAAGKYGFCDLKSEAEAWYLKGLKLEVGNVVETLLYSDGNSLPLVKDAAIKYLLENASEVMESESFLHLQQSLTLMTEVMKAMAKHNGTLRENNKRRRNN